MKKTAHTFRFARHARIGVGASTAFILALALAGTGVAHAQAPSKKSCSQGGVCKVGDKGPGGGLVFITRSTKGNKSGKNFEFAPDGWNRSQNVDDSVWCSSDADIPGAAGQAIGSGSANTDAILAIPECATGSAAAIARAYRGGGKQDWFLPSVKELLALNKVRVPIGSPIGPYWSSTQSPGSPDLARYVFFLIGAQNSYTKVAPWGGVLPVRAFS
jgi:hypothetical protein